MNTQTNPHRERFYEHVAACTVCQSVSRLCELGVTLFPQWRATRRGYEGDDTTARSERTVVRLPVD